MFYNLHSPRDKFFGCDEPQSLNYLISLANSMGLDMKKIFIPDGLNPYEEKYPDKAVIFDVRSEDVLMIES
jgi:hypothetical protein